MHEEWLLATAFLTPTVVLSAPVYLNCMFSVGNPEKVPWSLVLDEAAGTVVYSVKAMGTTQKAPAIFTADKVI